MLLVHPLMDSGEMTTPMDIVDGNVSISMSNRPKLLDYISSTEPNDPADCFDEEVLLG